MDHVLFVDFATVQMKDLLEGKRQMIARTGCGRKPPFSRIYAGESVYFVSDEDSRVLAKAIVKDVLVSAPGKGGTVVELIERNVGKLNLNQKEQKKLAQRKNLVLVEFGRVDKAMPFRIRVARTNDDWQAVDYINSVREA